MQVELAYGKTGLPLALPDDLNVTVIEPRYVPGVPDPAGLLDRALAAPIGSVSLAERVHSSDRVGIVFSDITRPTPNEIIIPAILRALSHVPDAQITLFNATGTHRPNTYDELRRMLGDGIVERLRIVQNDARAEDAHVRVGETPGGNTIWLLREFVECDVHILTGFIEPHFFAGFSGGGKAVMPGLARLDTIMHNHRAAHIDDSRARWGITDGNPLWEDVRAAAQMVPNTFLVNVTLNRDKQITAVFAGDLEEAHAQGCAYVKEHAMRGVPEPFDVVITSNSGYPLDLNVYQSVKGMSAAAQVVRPGGTIIIAADCWDGLPDHGQYRRLLAEARSTDDVLSMVRAPGFASQDMWQVQVQALVAERADILFYSHNLTDAQLRDALLTPCRDIGAALEQLRERYGEGMTVCVLPQGPQTIPYVLEAVSA